MKKVFLLLMLLILVATISVSLPASAGRKPVKTGVSGGAANLSKTTFGKIDSAVKKGRISKDYSLVLKARALLESESLADHYRGKPIKDGTFVLMDIRKQLGKVKIKRFKSKIKSLVEPGRLQNNNINAKGTPYLDAVNRLTTLSKLTESFSTENFDIRYTTKTSSADKVPVEDIDNDGDPEVKGGADGKPDYIQYAASILENVWSREIDSIGYSSPAGSDSHKFQVFFKNINNAYGLTYPVNTTGLYKSDAFIVMENDFADFSTPLLDALQVTAAHEFFHAIQFAYNDFRTDSGKNRWWMEATAVWIEDIVYPDVNDYLYYLYNWDGETGEEGWFAYPEKSLITFDGDREYGSGIFVKYLQRRADKAGLSGVSFIKSVWQSLDEYQLSTGNIINVLNNRLLNNGLGSFKTTYSEFMAQNFILDPSRSTGATTYSINDYDDMKLLHDIAWGSATPLIYIYNHRNSGFSFPVSKSLGSYEVPEYLGTNYNIIKAPATPTTAVFTFTGGVDIQTESQAASWSVQLLLKKSGSSSYDIKTLVPIGHSSGSLTVNNYGIGGAYNRAILIASVVGPVKYNRNYKYSFEATPPKDKSSISRPASRNYYTYGSFKEVAFKTYISPQHIGKKNVILEKSSLKNGGWTLVGTMKWDPILNRYVKTAPYENSKMYYRTRWTGDIDHLSAISRLTLLPIAKFSFSKTNMVKNENTVISGTVSPNLNGNNIVIQKYDNGWKNVATKPLNSKSGFSYIWTPLTRGIFKFRIKVPAATGRVTSYSTTKTVTVL